MKLIGEEDIAAFILGQIVKTKPDREAMWRELSASLSSTAPCRTPIDLLLEEPNVAILGFPVADRAVSGKFHLAVQPQVSFRGAQLVVIPEWLGCTVVHDLRVGHDSQLFTAGPIPAEMFSPCSLGGDINMDDAGVNHLIKVTLENAKVGIVRVGIVGCAVSGQANRPS